MKLILNRRWSLLVLLFSFMIASESCKKGGSGGGGGGGGTTEENLVVTIDPDPGTSIAKALGSTYALKVNVTSKMPPQGVTISVTYRKDSDNTVIFSQTVESSAAQTAITINNIPLNEVGTVTVIVTSKSKSTNTATKTFKLVRK